MAMLISWSGMFGASGARVMTDHVEARRFIRHMRGQGWTVTIQT